jgi:hypothetical protein
MAITRTTFAAATVSWIDAATELPEVDAHPLKALSVPRPLLTGSHGYRFCNFLEVWIEADFNKRLVIGKGFTPASRVYRGPSYLRIPSHAFMTQPEIFEEPDAVRFTQVVGARTVSPEVLGTGGGIVAGIAAGAIGGSFIPVIGTALGAVVGGVVGGLSGELVGHQVLGFPPIWSKIQIRMYRDGRTEAQLLQHSLFPSLTFYRQAGSASDAAFERVDIANGKAYYDATKERQLPDWRERGWGTLQRTSTPGPTSGNPWGIRKGVTGGAEIVPNQAT